MNVKNGPVRVSIDSRFTTGGDFAVSGISSAIEKWNSFSRASLGFNLFEIEQNDFSEAGTTPSGEDECDFGGSSDSSFRIVREDSISRWRALGLVSSSSGSVVPGVTARCSTGGRLNKQVVLINTRFTDSRQFSSVVLHELGHAIGLDHSCEGGAGSATFKGCTGLSSNHPYYVAVMFPIFRVSAPGSSGTDIKQALRANDMLRGQCLYNGK